MSRITDSELLLVSKASAEKLKNFADGASLTARARRTIRQLQIRVATDRVRLARRHLKDAQLARTAATPSPRTVVSRAYYAIYHAARAVTYVHHEGDDHEGHTVLAQKLPPDFPDCDGWKNRIKEARYDRNRADYDPYPASDADFEASGVRLMREAKEMIVLASKYIREKSV